MHKLLKVDNIMYRVKDLEKSTEFYQNVLGLKKVWTDDERHMSGFIFEQSDAEIVLTSDPEMPAFDYSYLVENVEAFCDSFEKKGHKLFLEPIDVRCGKYAILQDLDGNTIPIIDLTKFGNKPKYD